MHGPPDGGTIKKGRPNGRPSMKRTRSSKDAGTAVDQRASDLTTVAALPLVFDEQHSVLAFVATVLALLALHSLLAETTEALAVEGHWPLTLTVAALALSAQQPVLPSMETVCAFVALHSVFVLEQAAFSETTVAFVEEHWLAHSPLVETTEALAVEGHSPLTLTVAALALSAQQPVLPSMETVCAFVVLHSVFVLEQAAFSETTVAFVEEHWLAHSLLVETTEALALEEHCALTLTAAALALSAQQPVLPSMETVCAFVALHSVFVLEQAAFSETTVAFVEEHWLAHSLFAATTVAFVEEHWLAHSLFAATTVAFVEEHWLAQSDFVATVWALVDVQSLFAATTWAL
ncbi:MAG: hypothetical protein ACI835_002788 [Planctomycetota bacterium]|jgi:hypothetical protein